MISSTAVVRSKKFSEENSQNIHNLSESSKMTQKAPPAELPVEERNRGKRMMGVLMGTLSKFKSEEVDKSEANLKRILLEQRLAQKLSQAKEQLISSTQPERSVDSTLSMAEMESRRIHYSSKVLPIELEQIKKETNEAYAHFQQTITLPALYFKRAL